MHVSIEDDPFSSLFSEEKENHNKIDKIEEIRVGRILIDTPVTRLVTNHDPRLYFFLKFFFPFSFIVFYN